MTVKTLVIGIPPIGQGTRLGPQHTKVVAGHAHGIWGRANGIFANIEAQRMQGLHAHGLYFGGCVRPDDIAKAAHNPEALQILMDAVPGIASCQLSDVMRESFPPQMVPVYESELERWAFDPRIALNNTTHLDEFHYFTPGMEDFKMEYNSLCALNKGNDGFRRRDDGKIEMLNTLENVGEKCTLPPSLEAAR